MSASIYVTNAPEAYDYPATVLKSKLLNARFSDSLGVRDRQIAFRMLWLDDIENGYYRDYQIGRYKSGGYLVMTHAQYEKELREGFIIEETDEGS